MRRHQPSEDVATEPYAARGDDASGTFCLREKLFKRNFVLQKLVAVHLIAQKRDELLSGLTYKNTIRSSTTVVRYLASLSHAFAIAVVDDASQYWG